MRRWIRPLLLFVILVIISATTPRRLPYLADLLGLMEDYSELIQSLGSAVQLLIWDGAGVLLIGRLLRPGPLFLPINTAITLANTGTTYHLATDRQRFT